MTFRLTCPVCGKRDVYEFTYGGPERGPRPPEAAAEADS
ncbi:MAG: sarcosine oxidase subunit delta, partial [Gemmatimonadales bacterium]|nr:sarcosine oxidase subunit delta [Gemmatimonadales bacterium]